ncbi:amidohydrolase [Arthrobacter sp. zg-ZUI100]|uniref:Amidohydrolase n=1 Tax=Arthrobacter jiangjiafuii TaxID=2817475 RepID=A0A975M4B6_9MICC|nr:amidohydrolase [Arthrobacter jiangjiafuii]MBP3035175.1 amidohydrolase [Arthrobacter jiangjiafuii]MBP3042633.1 amidohydrolase [Arthrobacter jiangjiafuii]QWC09642.1 amidohydrolase [Arthrobacter jiangjiafuii]
MTLDHVDIAIINGYVLPMNNKAPISHGVVTIRNGMIAGVGEAGSVDVSGAKRVIDAKGGAIMPGLINSHTHNASNMLLRSLDEDAELWSWLESMWKLKRNFDPETLYWASLCGLIEMVRSGITCFNEHFDAYAVEPEAEALKVIPLRATLGYGFADRGIYEPISQWSWNALEHFEEKVARHHLSAEGRIHVALSPHAPYSVGEEMWKLTRTVADDHSVSIHTHLAEGMNEVRYMEQTYGTTSVQWLESLGFLGPDVTAAHCTRLNDVDRSIMAERGVKIAHCPVSNAKLVSGTLDLGAVVDAGITVGLATDGPASHNTMDMFQEMKFAGLIHKDRTQDPLFLPTRQLLNLATTGSAAAMHRPDLGQLATGHPADVIVVDFDTAHTLPVYDPESTLVYSSRADDVRFTIVGGNVLLDDKQIPGVDEGEVRRRFAESAHALRARSLA